MSVSRDIIFNRINIDYVISSQIYKFLGHIQCFGLVKNKSVSHLCPKLLNFEKQSMNFEFGDSRKEKEK